MEFTWLRGQGTCLILMFKKFFQTAISRLASYTESWKEFHITSETVHLVLGFGLLLALDAKQRQLVVVNGVINWLGSVYETLPSECKLLLINLFRQYERSPLLMRLEFLCCQGQVNSDCPLHRGFPVPQWPSQVSILLYLGVCSWCIVSSFFWCWTSLSNSSISLAASSPEIIQCHKALGFSVRPTALPSPLIWALICSCAWSWQLQRKLS